MFDETPSRVRISESLMVPMLVVEGRTTFPVKVGAASGALVLS
jgi:hypothetical protein